jgi:hypothetical protein
MEEVYYSSRLFTVNSGWSDRWQLYRRLMELEISCKCSTGKPLEVTVDTPTAAAQVWSVARQQMMERSQLVDWLDRCFVLDSARNSGEALYD